jgi:hypothetical protein
LREREDRRGGQRAHDRDRRTSAATEVAEGDGQFGQLTRSAQVAEARPIVRYPRAALAASDRPVTAQQRRDRTSCFSCDWELSEGDAANPGVGMGLAIGLGESLSGKDGQQVADLLLAGERVGQGQVGLDRVVVAAAVARA